MPPIKPPFDRLMSTVRRAASHTRGGHAVALSVLAAAAFGLAGLRAVDLPAPRPIDDGDRLRIEVVRPAEPEIAPGSIMDVGELVDGFQGLPPPLPPLTDVAWSYDDGRDDYDEVYDSARYETRRAAEAPMDDPRLEPERPSPVRAVQRWFGFDAPRRDFRAEREARRARLDAIERDARERRIRERHASERYRRERAEEARYAFERRRDEARQAPWGREDRLRNGPDDRPPPWAPPEAAFDPAVPPPPHSDLGR